MEKEQSYTTAYLVEQTPGEVFDAVNNVRGWWSEEVEGRTGELDGEFVFHYKDAHRSTQTITEFVPGKKVVWRVSKSRLGFVKDKSEWDGTEIIFEISRKGNKTELRFTHRGLAPAVECYGACSNAWSYFINESLRELITTGKGKPEEKEEANTEAAAP